MQEKVMRQKVTYLRVESIAIVGLKVSILLLFYRNAVLNINFRLKIYVKTNTALLLVLPVGTLPTLLFKRIKEDAFKILVQPREVLVTS